MQNFNWWRPSFQRGYLVLVFLFSILNAHAQNSRFSFSGRLLYPIRQDYMEQSVDTFRLSYNYFVGQDTFTIVADQRTNRTMTNQYKSALGAELQVNIDIPLAQRLKVMTGIGFRYHAFNVDRSTQSDSWIELSRDTIPHDESSMFPEFQFPCDCFENELPVSEIDRKTYYRQLYLNMPLSLDYALIPSRLHIQFGGFASFPLVSTREMQTLYIRTREEDNMVKCRYELADVRDHSGDGVRHVQVGIEAALRLNVFPNMSVDLGFRRQLTNVFVQRDPQQILLTHDD